MATAQADASHKRQCAKNGSSVHHKASLALLGGATQDRMKL
jgi:hypothetical protein